MFVPPARWLPPLLAAWLSATAAPLQADQPLEPVAEFAHLAGPLVEQYCFDCHSGDEPDAGLALHKIEGGPHFNRDRKTWQRVLERLTAGDMPPEGYDAPTADERQKLVGWIETRLDEMDCSGPSDPGWITLRRLNRDQYRNTIRDLLYIDYQPNKTFPPDDLAYGFDNNADMLSLTPVLLEKYLAAARDIARKAVQVPEAYTGPTFDIPKDDWDGGQYDNASVRQLWGNGAIDFVHQFSTPGRYWLRVGVSGDQAGDEPVRMGFVQQGQLRQQVEVYSNGGVPEEFTFAFDVPAGKQRLGVAFLNDYFDRPSGDDRNLSVSKMELFGPANLVEREMPRAHRKWFADGPTPEAWRTDNGWRPQVRQSLEAFATTAFRRPANSEVLDRVVGLIDSRRRAGDTYERAMAGALEAMLVSPRFLFIGNVEYPVPSAEDDSVVGQEVDEYELAARLSYFLWSSMPDATLMRLAGEGSLRTQLDAQIKRMLRDRRAEEFTTNFTGQWLGTRLLAEFEPDESQIAGFDDRLRTAMAREAQLVFAEVLRRNLPITTLLDADFTYLNERLAEHYDLQGIRGNHFRRVSLDELPAAAGVRGGVITMAGVLTVTSNPDRTSPVKRGKWILGELLAAEPPAPPPGIASLDAVTQASDKPLSLREQMELHRADPSCAACHVQMDPLGLALENFDLVGRWRTSDAAGPIDSMGQLPGGDEIDGAGGLKAVLLERRDAFRRCLAEKMMIYALGRGLEYYDECSIAEITRRTEADEDRLQSLVMAIVESPPFQQRRVPAAE